MALGPILVFATVALPIGAIQLAVTVHLPRYFAGHLGLSLAAVGGAFALVRLIDIPLDALLGVAMDKTRTRFGRYRVWLALSAPILMLALYMLMLSPAGVGMPYLVGWLLVMYLAYSGIFLSHVAWAANLATSYQQRSRIFGVITALGVIGAVGVLLIPVFISRQGGTEAQGVQAMIWAIIAAIPLTILLALSTTSERITRDDGEHFGLKDYLALLARPNVLRLLAADLCVTLGPGWMAALYFFYFKDSRGFDTAGANLLLLIYIATGLIGAPATALLANRIGKHRALIASTLVYSAVLVILPFIPPGEFLYFAPGMMIAGAAYSGFLVMTRALTGDIADEIRLEKGREWMGLMYALTNATSKIAGACSIFLTFNVLEAVGYQAADGAVNTPGAIHGLELAFIVGPIVFVTAAGACFIGYRLTADRHAEIRRQLDARDLEFDSAPAGLAGEAPVVVKG